MGLQPPPPPPPPPPRLAALGMAGGGATHTIPLNLEQGPAFDQAVAALQALGCEIQWQSPPSDVKFAYRFKSFWSTGGFAITYAGDMAVVRVGPGQSQLRLTLRLNWGSATPVFLTSVIAVVFLTIFSGPYALSFGFFYLLLGAAGVAWSAWRFSSQTPQDMAGKLQKQLQGAAGAHVAAPAPVFVAPAPAPAPVAPTPAAPVANAPVAAPVTPKAPPPAAPAAAPTPPQAADDDESVLDQIKKLAELRDMGAVTAAEFDAKKTELLKRL